MGYDHQTPWKAQPGPEMGLSIDRDRSSCGNSFQHYLDVFNVHGT